MEMKKSMSQQCALIANNANCILDCNGRSGASTTEGVIAPFTLHWRDTPGIQLQFQKDVEKLEKSHWRIAKMVRGLGLRDLGLFLRGGTVEVIVTYNYWKDSYKGSGDKLFL